MGKTALIAGASGLVGSELLKILLEKSEYEHIIAVVRSPLNITNTKLEERIVDFEELAETNGLPTVDDVFCCLGTTIKKAKTQEAMTRIDVDYPIALANLGKTLGAKQYFVISSLGADAKSSIFYSRIKGLMEIALKGIGFQTLGIFRPSLLLGKRSEFRIGEAFATVLMPILSLFMVGEFRKYRGIQARVVALAMFKVAQSGNSGVNIYLSDEISKIAGS
ncbi:NAD-dependent epimerase/dehydratase family protein [Bacillus marasmi]|uniref:NAD-dependent epimerase/dehydratase family protein n=1 Tax=Bacillus marasmi TaxID=1926279 RepID=UPI0011C7D746|nr:NAD(P)H-binding protein [Bacillus marasmi]